MPALLAYARNHIDRRADLLTLYINRLQRHGRMEGKFCTIDVEYYRPPSYGRLMVRGAAGQKLTRVARRAAFGSHSVEIDASCCHPCLLAHTLNVHSLWDSTKFAYARQIHRLPERVASLPGHCRCQGGAHSYILWWSSQVRDSLPLKICDEVQKAATALLRTAQAQPLLDLYNDRPNPDFRFWPSCHLRKPSCWSLCTQRWGNTLMSCSTMAATSDAITCPQRLRSWMRVALVARHSFRCTWSPGLWSLMLYKWVRQHSEHQDAGGRSWRRSCRSNASPACTMRSPSCALTWTLVQLEKWTKMASSLPRTSTAMLCLRPKD